MTKELASILIVTYNHKKYIEACLSSIATQEYPHEIIVIDNCSIDGTPEFIEEQFPDVKLIKSQVNNGYGAGNNFGVRFAKGKILVILNPDTRVEKNWLKNLIEPINKGNNIITTPKILLYDGSAINTSGNINHFTGLAFTRGLGKPPEAYDKIEQVTGVSGACFALRKEDFIAIGGFDENFFLYMEDTDFSWRANALGYKILTVPNAIIYHDYILKMTPEKLYHLERGRYKILKKFLSPKKTLLLLPSLSLVELLVFGYTFQMGRTGLKYKLNAIMQEIFKNSYNNKMSGYQVIGRLSLMIPEDQPLYGNAGRFGISIANKLFQLNAKALI